MKAATSKTTIAFRSYRVHQAEESGLKIWQAVQATLAAEGLLNPVKVGGRQREDTYGPSTAFDLSTISDLWAEAQMILIDGDQKLEDHLDCLVSVGMNFMKYGDGEATLDGISHTSASISSAIRAAYAHFTKSHWRLVSSDKICRLELQTELDISSRLERREEHLHTRAAVEQHFATKSISEYIMKCANEAASHQSTSHVVREIEH